MSPPPGATGDDPARLSSQYTQAALIDTALTLLGHVCSVLSTSVTTSAQLSFDSLLTPGATIGKHLRHILDHYRLLLDVVQDPTLPLLSYDRRVRMTLIETSVPDALEAVQTVQDRLKAVRSLPHWLKRKVKLEAVTPEEVQLETTLGRELWFVSLHAIHHLASIRVIAVGELDLSLPSDFGLAPSTAVSRQASDPSPSPAQDDTAPGKTPSSKL